MSTTPSTSTKESTMVKTESDTSTGNGKGMVPPEGIAMGIVDGLEGLSTIAREQTAQSFRQGERVANVVRDQSIVMIRAVETLGVAALTALRSAATPLVPRLPSLTPVDGLDTVVKAGFDVGQQVLTSQRKVAESAVSLVASLAA
jgi:hypothetical protein